MNSQSITPSEAATLLWGEWQYRHELFWRSLYRWGAASVTVSVVPWIKPDLITDLKYYVFLFPALASLMAIVAAWLIASEYARLVKVNAKYKGLLGDFAPDRIEGGFMATIFRPPIGWVVPAIFLVLAIPISWLNAFLLNAKLSEGLEAAKALALA